MGFSFDRCIKGSFTVSFHLTVVHPLSKEPNNYLRLNLISKIWCTYLHRNEIFCISTYIYIIMKATVFIIALAGIVSAAPQATTTEIGRWCSARPHLCRREAKAATATLRPVLPTYQACGGHVVNPKTCPKGYICVDNPRTCSQAVDCPGICVIPQACGGFAGFPCPAGKKCYDDPRDDCDPNNGGADCIGICI
ncbi:hypothetical protein TWF225_008458 [Orbilia oligospora]|nr:hypothetical protein TWF225_008458 [Orbilia oligospora]KAF3240168.1 hypothetical protein TWF217_001092 [Orbilia oligospora]KAF3249185.1 hypothetical protein TWF128_007866 [Orbilia oligospora]KAF3279588.1 hypothetical protein TWF132_000577 [Orbilia oligospora]